MFVAFTLVSGSVVAAGSPTCGCLGGAKISPAVVLTFDALVLVLLVLIPFGGPWQPADRLAARITAGTAALGALGVGVAVLWLGSWFVATAALRDQPMAVNPVVISVGKCRAGQPVEAIVTFTNMTDERIQVILIQSDRIRLASARIRSPTPNGGYAGQPRVCPAYSSQQAGRGSV